MLPALLKPTGKPQRTVATAQKEFVRYTDDIAKVQIPDKQPPLILIVTEPSTSEEDDKEKIKQIIVNCDGHKYERTTVVQAIAVAYKFCWLFGVAYPKSCNNVWMVIQKFFFKMSYRGESCSPDANNFLKKLSQASQNSL